MQNLSNNQAQLSSALSRLMAVAENYPDLKASQNFLDLQAQLEGTENRINVARQRYNSAVKTFNYSIMSFFGSLVNGLMIHAQEKQYFRASNQAQDAPKVKF